MPAEPAAAAGRVLLFGDSHFVGYTGERLDRLRAALGGRTTITHAVGGSTAGDAVRQILLADLRPDDVLVVSVGTNDLAPWKQVPIEVFRTHLAHLVEAARDHQVVLLSPPPLDEAAQRRLRPQMFRAASDRAPYVAAVRSIAAARDLLALELPDSDEIHTEDGVHLSDQGYDLLTATIGRALTSPIHRRLQTVQRDIRPR